MLRWSKFSALVLEGLFVSLLLPMMVAGAPEAQPARTYLHKDWQVQSSCEATATGEQISSARFDAKNWHKTDIPATVVGDRKSTPSELQSHSDLVCRLLLEKKKKNKL